MTHEFLDEANALEGAIYRLELSLVNLEAIKTKELPLTMSSVNIIPFTLDDEERAYVVEYLIARRTANKAQLEKEFKQL